MVESWLKLTGILPGMWKHRRAGLITAVVLSILGATLALVIPGVYQASARAYVDTQSILKPLMEGMTVAPNVEQQVQMMARTLISAPNLEKVAKITGLDKAATTEKKKEALIEELTKDIRMRPAGGSNFYLIEYRNRDQDAALKVVESLMDIFVQSNQTNQSRDTQRALTFIDEQIASQEKELLKTESALKEFKIANINVMPNLAQDYVARTAEMQREVQVARNELREASYARSALRSRLASVPQTLSAGDSSEGGGRPSDTERRLGAAQARLEDLKLRYTDVHPDVLNQQRTIQDLERALRREQAEAAAAAAGAAPRGTRMVPNKLYQDLSITLADADAKVASLTARVADAEARVAQSKSLAKTIPKVEAEYIQLNRDYEVTKANYDKLLARRESAKLAGSMGENSGTREFRIVDPPRVSYGPVSPNRPLLLLGALMGSIAAGLLMSFFLDRLNPSYFDQTSLKAITGLPVLGTVTFVESDAARAQRSRARTGFIAFALGWSALFFAGAAALIFGGRFGIEKGSDLLRFFK